MSSLRPLLADIVSIAAEETICCVVWALARSRQFGMVFRANGYPARAFLYCRDGVMRRKQCLDVAPNAFHITTRSDLGTESRRGKCGSVRRVTLDTPASLPTDPNTE